ncbi:MAG: phosphatidate cytidylyltransferase [bacterium]|nr:phosphatidate cytidylyltransferase [bacterium]
MGKITTLGKKSIFGLGFAFAVIGLCQTKISFIAGLLLLCAGAVWETWSIYLGPGYTDKDFPPTFKVGLLFAGMLIGFSVLAEKFPVWYCLALIGTYCLVDVCANLWGSFWSKTLKKPTRRFAPIWSPNKTWAGVWAGLVGGSFGLPLLIWLMQIHYQPALTGENIFVQAYPFSQYASYALGFTIAWLAIRGDLIFSQTKRQLGIKDFTVNWRGRQICLLRSHGGVLDRVDSWTLATIFVAAWLHLSLYRPLCRDLIIFAPMLVAIDIVIYEKRQLT